MKKEICRPFLTRPFDQLCVHCKCRELLNVGPFDLYLKWNFSTSSLTILCHILFTRSISIKQWCGSYFVCLKTRNINELFWSSQYYDHHHSAAANNTRYQGWPLLWASQRFPSLTYPLMIFVASLRLLFVFKRPSGQDRKNVFLLDSYLWKCWI